jgi:hypothetical protein
VFHTLAIAFPASPPSATAQQRRDSTMKNGTTFLTAFKGDVKISTTSSDQTQAPSKGAVLKQGQVVVIAPKSKASLAFENGIVMEDLPSSKFVIQDFQRPATSTAQHNPH